MGEKKIFSTRVDEARIRSLKYLSVDTGRSLGDLLEEAIQDLIVKHRMSGGGDFPQCRPFRARGFRTKVQKEKEKEIRLNELAMITKIISGGQTGADRAALDVAIKLDIHHGGWIPKGRKTEDGTLPRRYRLREMQTDSYPKRTEQNVVDSDGTLIITHGPLTRGSNLTKKMAVKHDRPWIHVDLDNLSVDAAIQILKAWINGNEINTLNVAGSRASKDPTIYQATMTLFKAVLHQ